MFLMVCLVRSGRQCLEWYKESALQHDRHMQSLRSSTHPYVPHTESKTHPQDLPTYFILLLAASLSRSLLFASSSPLLSFSYFAASRLFLSRTAFFRLSASVRFFWPVTFSIHLPTGPWPSLKRCQDFKGLYLKLRQKERGDRRMGRRRVMRRSRAFLSSVDEGPMEEAEVV